MYDCAHAYVYLDLHLSKFVSTYTYIHIYIYIHSTGVETCVLKSICIVKIKTVRNTYTGNITHACQEAQPSSFCEGNWCEAFRHHNLLRSHGPRSVTCSLPQLLPYGTALWVCWRRTHGFPALDETTYSVNIFELVKNSLKLKPNN